VAQGCDIIRIHRAQVCDFVWNGVMGRNLVAKVGPSQGHPASFLMFDGRDPSENDFGEDATSPYQCSSQSFSWEPQAEPAMLEALRMLSTFMARQVVEAEEAFAAAVAAAEQEGGEEVVFGAFAGKEGAAPAALPAPLQLMGPRTSAVRHVGHVLFGEAGSCDLGPVRVEAVEKRENSGSGGSSTTVVLWVFDGSDAPPLPSETKAKVTLARLSVALAANAAAANAAGGDGGENRVVDAATAAAVNGGTKTGAPGNNADLVVVPSGPARDVAELPEYVRAAILGASGSDNESGRRRRRCRVPPASISSPPPVGTLLPVVFALPRGAPAPPLPAVGEWVTIHKLAVASVAGGGGVGQQAVGVYLESSHWARAAVSCSSSSSSSPSMFRVDPAVREREGDTASWAPRDRSLLVAVPGTTNADVDDKKKDKRKRGRGEEAAPLAPLPARATLRALSLRAKSRALAEAGGGGGDGEDEGDGRKRSAVVRARVLCRVVKAEPSHASSSSSSSLDLDLVLEDATGVVEAALTGREAAAFFGGASTSSSSGSSTPFSLAERCAGLVSGADPSRRVGPWAELVIETSVAKAAAAAPKSSKKRRGGGNGGGGSGGGKEGREGKEEEEVVFAVVDSVSRWPLPSSSAPSAVPIPSPGPRLLGSPLAATQAVPRSAAAVGGGEATALAPTQAVPPPPQLLMPLLLAPTQAVGTGQQLTQTQAPVGLAETFLLSPLRKAAAAVRSVFPGGE